MVGSGQFYATGYAFDLPAILITLIVTAILVRGVSESAFTNAIMVAIKVAVVLFVIIAVFAMSRLATGPMTLHPTIRWDDLLWPTSRHVWRTTKGMMAGAAGIIFAYLVSMQSRLKPKKPRILNEICRSALSGHC